MIQLSYLIFGPFLKHTRSKEMNDDRAEGQIKRACAVPRRFWSILYMNLSYKNDKTIKITSSQ